MATSKAVRDAAARLLIARVTQDSEAATDAIVDLLTDIPGFQVDASQATTMALVERLEAVSSLAVVVLRGLNTGDSGGPYDLPRMILLATDTFAAHDLLTDVVEDDGAIRFTIPRKRRGRADG